MAASGLLAALALDALAVVVELGGRAQQAILQRVPLAAQYRRADRVCPAESADSAAAGGSLRADR